jgi:hypothetical protein
MFTYDFSIVSFHVVGLGGLMVIVLAIGTKISGFKPGRVRYTILCSVAITIQHYFFKSMHTSVYLHKS